MLWINTHRLPYSTLFVGHFQLCWNTQGVISLALMSMWGHYSKGWLHAWAQWVLRSKQAWLLILSVPVRSDIKWPEPLPEIPRINTSFLSLWRLSYQMKKNDFKFGLSFSQCRHSSRLFPLPTMTSAAHLGWNKQRSIRNACKLNYLICSLQSFGACFNELVTLRVD